MTLIARAAASALLLAPCLALGQSFTVNQAFQPGHYVPMDGHQRLRRWWNEDGRSPAIHVEAFTAAAATQFVNTPPEWGRNTGGYFRRLGNSYGRLAIQSTVEEGMAAVERTDTRYFACGCRGFLRRTGHVVQMTFLTYAHNGSKTLDLPQLSGAYGSSMIATLWWPRRYSPLVQGVQNGHIEVGIIGVVHMLQEFAPELERTFHLHLGQAAAARP